MTKCSVFSNTGETHTFYIAPVGKIVLSVFTRVGEPDRYFYSASEIIRQVSPQDTNKDNTFLRMAVCRRSIMLREGLPADDVRGSLPEEVAERHYGYDFMGRLFMQSRTASDFMHFLLPALTSHLFDVQVKHD